MDLSNLTGKLKGSRYGVAGVFGLLAALVAGGVVAHDSPEIQAAAGVAVGLVATGIVVAGRALIARLLPAAAPTLPAPEAK